MSAGGFDNQTLREIVYPSAGGSQVRVRLSNVFGTQPLVVGAASIGVQLAGANVVPGTLKDLTFGGNTSVTIPAGQEVLSDPARYHVAAEENLAISIYLPDGTGPRPITLMPSKTTGCRPAVTSHRARTRPRIRLT